MDSWGSKGLGRLEEVGRDEGFEEKEKESFSSLAMADLGFERGRDETGEQSAEDFRDREDCSE